MRQSAATNGNDSTPQLPTLNDSDQPFLFNVRLHGVAYRLEFYDASYPHQHWTLLKPDIVILAFDISDRKSLEKLGEVCQSRFSAACLPHRRRQMES